MHIADHAPDVVTAREGKTSDVQDASAGAAGLHAGDRDACRAAGAAIDSSRTLWSCGTAALRTVRRCGT